MEKTTYSFGIKNYQPSFFSLNKITPEKTNLLELILKANLNSILIVWSIVNQEEWLDSPIILVTDKGRLEICCQKSNEISITLNTIDICERIDWYGDQQFEWKEIDIFDFKITDIKWIELYNEISNLTSNPGFNSNWWDLGGIQLISGSKKVSIYNGFDTNILSFDTTHKKGLRTINLR